MSCKYQLNTQFTHNDAVKLQYVYKPIVYLANHRCLTLVSLHVGMMTSQHVKAFHMKRALAYPSIFLVLVPSQWWRHQLEPFSSLLAICAGNSPVTGEFPAQRPVTRNFDVFFDLRLNKRLSKQSWGCWFETLSCPLWRHGYAMR